MRDTLIVFGAFTILSTMALVVHRASLDTTDETLAHEANLIAITSAQQILGEVGSMNFDEHTIGRAVLAGDSILTPVDELGPEPGETVRDDVDDYNGYTEMADSVRFPGILLSVHVAYADPADPTDASSVPTRMKRITVTAEDPHYLTAPITLSSVVAWY